ATNMDGTRSSLMACSLMGAATRGGHTSGRHAGPGAHGAGVHHLATGNGDVDWQLLEPRWRKRQRVGGEHDDVRKLPDLDAPEVLFLEARIRGVDGLAPQGLWHSERLASRDLLAAEGLVRYRSTEIPQRIHRIVAWRVRPEAQGEARVP